MHAHSFLSIPTFVKHTTVALDLSDSVAYLVELTTKKIHGRENKIPQQLARIALPDGLFATGKVNQPLLTQFLKGLKKKYHIDSASVVLPKEEVHMCTLSIDRSQKDIEGCIERGLSGNAPTALSHMVYDWTVLSETVHVFYIEATLIKKEFVEVIERSFIKAGITVDALIPKGHALSHSLLSDGARGSTMIVDIGMNETTVSIATNAVTTLAATVDFSVTEMIAKIAEKSEITSEEVGRMLRTEGFALERDIKPAFRIVVKYIGLLIDQLNDVYIAWHQARYSEALLPNVSELLISGAFGSIPGLDDYLATALKIPLAESNPWKNCFSFDDVVPSISRESALGYSGAIGAALVDTDTINLSPRAQKRSTTGHAFGAFILIVLLIILNGFVLWWLVRLPQAGHFLGPISSQIHVRMIQ